MRRLESQRGGSLFRRNEWFRFVSMLFMLVILYMMIQRARDANVWRWLANDTNVPTSELEQGVTSPIPSVDETEVLFEGPNDLDEDEIDAAKELFSAISDRTSLSVEEMPAYWRLVRWSRAQSLQDLKKRSRRDVTLAHLIDLPDKYRGKLVRLRLHLRRSLSWEVGPEEKSGGAKTVYEAWGWADESPNFYCTVFTKLPPGMAIGPNVFDEVTFYGYFLKLIGYRDQQDKMRMAPLLIGHVERHGGMPAAPNEGPWVWAIFLGGGFVLLIIVVRWTRAYAFPAARQEPINKEAERASLKKWLETSAGEPEQPVEGFEGDAAGETQDFGNGSV